MIKQSFILMLTGILINMSFPNLSDASLGSLPDTHTHTNTLELKPASLSNSYQIASVCFLGVGDCVGDGFDMSVDTAEQCLNEGFAKSNCSSVQQVEDVCPYNPAYGKGCKCKTNLITCPSGQTGIGESCGGKYATCGCASNLKTCASNQNGVGTACGGKYESCVCKPEYQYTSSNCSSPRFVSGSSCEGKYTGCSCPTGVSAGAYGCKEYYPAPCGSACKIAYTDNCHMRTTVSTPYGCMSYFSDCPSKCERAYPDNCRNRTAVTCQFGCTSNFADCSSKCQSCEADNCANRTAVDTPYGCQTYWSDCSSKCQVAYADNCHNRLSIVAPIHAECAMTYADCSSKCAGWTCNDGYTKSGNECIKDAPKTCEDYGYSSIEALGTKCQSRYVAELSKFCFTSDCKTCDTGVKCLEGCAKYNMGEFEADIYGCPRVCVSCNTVTPEKPSCGSQTLITCSGINYCCEPRFATCYYTTPHNFADGTTTYLCSLHSMQQQQISGEVIGGGEISGIVGGTITEKLPLNN